MQDKYAYPKSTDYEHNMNIPVDFDDAYTISIFGKSRVGKTYFLNQLIKKHFAHWVLPWNIYVMSPTFEDDKSMTETWNLIWKYVKNYDDHVFNWVKMDVI